MKDLLFLSLFMTLASSQKAVSNLAKKATTTMREKHPEQRLRKLDHGLEQKSSAQLWSDTKGLEAKEGIALPETPVHEDSRPAMNNEDESHRYPTLNEDLDAKLRSQIWSDTKHHKKATGTKRLGGST